MVLLVTLLAPAGTSQAGHKVTFTNTTDNKTVYVWLWFRGLNLKENIWIEKQSIRPHGSKAWDLRGYCPTSYKLCYAVKADNNTAALRCRTYNCRNAECGSSGSLITCCRSLKVDIGIDAAGVLYPK
jgi:hypothetical protein